MGVSVSIFTSFSFEAMHPHTRILYEAEGRGLIGLSGLTSVHRDSALETLSTDPDKPGAPVQEEYLALTSAKSEISLECYDYSKPSLLEAPAQVD